MMEQIEEENEIMLIDKHGNKLNLTEKQLAYLNSLSNVEDPEEDKVPTENDFEMLQNINPVELNRILDENKTHGGIKQQL